MTNTPENQNTKDVASPSDRVPPAQEPWADELQSITSKLASGGITPFIRPSGDVSAHVGNLELAFNQPPSQQKGDTPTAEQAGQTKTARGRDVSESDSAKQKPATKDANGTVVCDVYRDLPIAGAHSISHDRGTFRIKMEDPARFPEPTGEELRLSKEFSGNVKVHHGQDGKPEKLVISNVQGIQVYGKEFVGTTILGRKVGKEVWGEAPVLGAEYSLKPDGQCHVSITINHPIRGAETQRPSVKPGSAMTDLIQHMADFEKSKMRSPKN